MSGAVVYAGVVILANVKLLNSFSTYAFWGEFFIVLSIASYFICFWVENLIVRIPELFGIFGLTMLNPMTYFCLMLSGLSLYVMDLMIMIFKDLVRTKLILKKERTNIFYRALDGIFKLSPNQEFIFESIMTEKRTVIE